MQQAGPAIGDRVRVHPSGATGQVTSIVPAADGRLTYQVEFDEAPAGMERGSLRQETESGGLYVLEDIEPVS